ncbi:unnamed protein product [Ceutorhynchus assimilis]|uniref:Uncharacterized protein n=1 Tax=Ceutorhynchus assimilis TaxID=467358 RepID=A0A9N9MWT2_9CUCU|nr:unnamed protein product [Ceutorhynchus assimilis]
MPEAVNDGEAGYHSSCYRRFSAVDFNKYKPRPKVKHPPPNVSAPLHSLIPSTSAGQPSTSAGQPSTSAGQPSNSAGQPSLTLDYCCSISPSTATVHTADIERDQKIQRTSADEGANTSNLQDLKDFHGQPDQKCFFCRKCNKRRNGRLQLLIVAKSDRFLKKMKTIATEVNDIDVLLDLSFYVASNSPFIYHKVCYRSYLNKMNKKLSDKHTAWHDRRNHYKKAYQNLCEYINAEILSKKRCALYSDICQYFQIILKEQYDNVSLDVGIFCTSYLKKKLLATFGEKIQILEVEGSTVLAYGGINELADTFISRLKINSIIRKAALSLRDEIKNIDTNTLPEELNAQQLIQGECDIPELLILFWSTLLSGFDLKKKKSTKCERLVKSFSEDMIYAVSNGAIKTSGQYEVFENKFNHMDAAWGCPTESGWKLEGNKLVFNWFDGPALPTGVISDIVIDREDSDEDDDEEISNTDVKYEFDTSEDDGSDNEDLGVEETTQEFDVPYTITGPQQARPSDFLGSLENYRFKEVLIKFLANYWESDHLAPIIRTKIFFITVETQCYSYQSIEKHVVRTEEIDYECYHEEADTRIMLHISKVQPTSKILVKASDTDILIILLGNMHKVPETEIGLASSGSKTKNDKDFNCINCIELASKLGSSLCLSLPAFHAFTGSDYTAAFYNKGKIRPYKILSKNESYQKMFASLKDSAEIFIESN